LGWEEKNFQKKGEREQRVQLTWELGDTHLAGFLGRTHQHPCPFEMVPGKGNRKDVGAEEKKGEGRLKKKYRGKNEHAATMTQKNKIKKKIQRIFPPKRRRLGRVKRDPELNVVTHQKAPPERENSSLNPGRAVLAFPTNGPATTF